MFRMTGLRLECDVADFVSPFEVFLDQAQRRPEAPFLLAPPSAHLPYAPQGFRFTYGQLLDDLLATSARFAEAGYGLGDRVALLLENRPEFFVYWLALNRLGVVILPLNPDLRREELAFQLTLTEITLMIVHDDRIEDVRAWQFDGVEIAGVGQDIARKANPPPAGTPDRSTTCALLFTSGSSGAPKACILSNGYFLELAEWYITQGGIATMEEGAEIALTPLPLFHMNALGCTSVGMMRMGGAVVPLDRFHASNWWDVIADSKATIVHCLGVIPAIVLQLPHNPAERSHNVKFALGPGVGAKQKLDFEERYGIPIVEAWAMTETGGRAVTSTAADDYEPGQRCIGRPRKGMEYRIVLDDGADAPLGTPGELLVRASGSDPRDGFFSGYLHDEAATEDAWKGGWFHTGDVVYADAGGLLYFFDRKKFIVRRSGENIAVLEVETALARDSRLVAAAVSPVPDPLRDEEVFAFVVLAGGVAPTQETADDIVVKCGEVLAYHKVPGYVAFISGLPLGLTQKLQRGEIKAMARARVEAGDMFDCRKLKSGLRKAVAVDQKK